MTKQNKIRSNQYLVLVFEVNQYLKKTKRAVLGLTPVTEQQSTVTSTHIKSKYSGKTENKTATFIFT